MPTKKVLAKRLEICSRGFLNKERRKLLLRSLEKGDWAKWADWRAKMKGVLKNLDRTDAFRFSTLLLVLERSPKSRFAQNELTEFLRERVEFYKNYDFSGEKGRERKGASAELWISKIFRILISRSFVGILIIGLILGFIVWFYLDRESCVDFVNKVVQPFLRVIR